MEDIRSETFNTEIKKNQQRSINDIKNIPDGINSRLDETEEQINDLEYKVMGSNKAKQRRGKKII